MAKPPVEYQGKAIVERGDDGELLVMFPDGNIERATSPRGAYRKVKAWFKEKMDVDALNVGIIEWRHGIKPPKV